MILLLLACAEESGIGGYEPTWGHNDGTSRCVDDAGEAIVEVEAFGEGDVYNAGVVVVADGATYYRPLAPAGHRAWADEIVLPGVTACDEAESWTFSLVWQVEGGSLVDELCPVTMDCVIVVEPQAGR